MSRVKNRVLDRCGHKWEAMGKYMMHRSGTVIGLMLSLIVVVVIAFSTRQNTTDINEIQGKFCNGNVAEKYDRVENCQKLLDNLLRNPTPRQAIRLRQIVEEK